MDTMKNKHWVLMAGMALMMGWVGTGCGKSADAGRAKANDPQVEADILGVIETLFQGMEQKDSLMLSRAMVPTASVHRVQLDSAGEQKIIYLSGRTFFQTAMNTGFTQQEEMWDPVVTVNGDLATVTAPFSYRLNGVFGHCGVNHFGLMQGTQGWRIHSVQFSITSRDSTECASQYPRSADVQP